MPAKPSAYARVYAAVSRIPAGQVATYGQIAALVRLPRGARQVGYALAALPVGTLVPWHRVVNARGALSLRGHGGVTQEIRLAREGVRLDSRGRVDLSLHRWPASKSRTARPGP